VTLDRLLARLDSDAEQAAAEYERLRRALVKFFDWRGAWPADECADEVLDRLMQRLADHQPVDDVRAFAYGIARIVLLERRRMPQTFPIDAATELVAATVAAEEPSGLFECFDSCLAAMTQDRRVLIVGYYEGEGRNKIANRRRLARDLGLSDAALRSRVQRLRDSLERCVEECTRRFLVK
jgi:DNA-directed RNA polymerase specialized sigma24 family protein